MIVNFKKILIIVQLLILNASYAQLIEPKLGLLFQTGTHITRIGIMYQLVYREYAFNVLQSGSFYYNFKNLGAPLKGFELKLNTGFIHCWGHEHIYSEYLFSETSTIYNKQYSAGFIASYFYNKIETSQWIGKLIYRSKNVGFLFENDVLGYKGYQDKYRTGAIAFIYTEDQLEYKIKSSMWTGNTFKAKLVTDSDYPTNNGYRDLRDARYGKYSHGILALSIDYASDYHQTIGVDAGIDAEQIRHVLQNRLMHDIILQEKIIKTKNPHYPMLQEDGTPYLFEDSTKVRPPKLYFQSGVNRATFY